MSQSTYRQGTREAGWAPERLHRDATDMARQLSHTVGRVAELLAAGDVDGAEHEATRLGREATELVVMLGRAAGVKHGAFAAGRVPTSPRLARLREVMDLLDHDPASDERAFLIAEATMLTDADPDAENEWAQYQAARA